jgi:hypothetical protein
LLAKTELELCKDWVAAGRTNSKDLSSDNNLVETLPCQRGRPTFNVRALKSDGYVIDAIWPDGSIELVAGVFVAPESAAKWVNEQGDAWIKEHRPSYH